MLRSFFEENEISEESILQFFCWNYGKSSNVQFCIFLIEAKCEFENIDTSFSTEKMLKTMVSKLETPVLQIESLYFFTSLSFQQSIFFHKK